MMLIVRHGGKRWSCWRNNTKRAVRTERRRRIRARATQHREAPSSHSENQNSQRNGGGSGPLHKTPHARQHCQRSSSPAPPAATPCPSDRYPDGPDGPYIRASALQHLYIQRSPACRVTCAVDSSLLSEG